MRARASALLARGFTVVGAVPDGASALAAAADAQPDVIVVDISMPGMNGLDLAGCLRASGSPARLVFLTVHDEEAFVRAARDAGGTGYVVKRRMMSDLVTAVGEAFAGRRFVSALG